MKQIICFCVSVLSILMCCSKDTVADHPIVGNWTYIDEYHYYSDSTKKYIPLGSVWAHYSNKGFYIKYGEDLVSKSVKYVVEGEKLKIYNQTDVAKYDYYSIKKLSTDSLILEIRDSNSRKIRIRHLRKK